MKVRWSFLGPLLPSRRPRRWLKTWWQMATLDFATVWSNFSRKFWSWSLKNSWQLCVLREMLLLCNWMWQTLTLVSLHRCGHIWLNSFVLMKGLTFPFSVICCMWAAFSIVSSGSSNRGMWVQLWQGSMSLSNNCFVFSMLFFKWHFNPFQRLHFKWHFNCFHFNWQFTIQLSSAFGFCLSVGQFHLLQ